jgi:hypothetical protein
MFGFRRIIPDDGYCLFFPDRPEGRRFVVGQAVTVKPREQWRHIQLGAFPVRLSDTADGGLFTTEENLECEVKAEFMLWMGGPTEGREARLAKATEGSAPTRDINRKVQVASYSERIANFARTSIKRVLKTKTQVGLIQDSNYLAETVQEIERDLRESLNNIGLILVDSTIVLQPFEPKDHKRAPKDVLDAWRRRQQMADQAAHERRQDEIEHEKRGKELEHQVRVHALELAEKRKAKEREFEILEEQALNEKEAIVQKIKEERNRLQKELKLYELRTKEEIECYELQTEDEIERTKEEKEVERENRRRSNEASQLEHELTMIQRRREILQERHELRKLEEELALMENQLERIRGETRVELIEKEALARSAHTLKMQEILTANLPSILQEANRPIEKMGEVRIINLSGAAHNSAPDRVLSGILASASTLPIIQEVLQSIRDFEPKNQQNTTE